MVILLPHNTIYGYHGILIYIPPITKKSVTFDSRENCSGAPRLFTWRKNQLPDNGSKIDFLLESRPTIRTNQNSNKQIFTGLFLEHF